MELTAMILVTFGLVFGVPALVAQLKLFSMDKTLNEILQETARSKAVRQSPTPQQPHTRSAQCRLRPRTEHEGKHEQSQNIAAEGTEGCTLKFL
jgi:hypothetical protein